MTEALNIGLGTMLGAGIFVLAATAAERAGPAAVFSYVAAGFICLSVALVVSELATGIPRAGGSYTFITQALGPLAGSIVGPGNWLGLTFANGFYLLAFGQYLSYISPLPPWSGSLLAGMLFIWLNYRGAKITGRVQNVVVVILVIILMLFVGIGSFNVDTDLYQPFAPEGLGAITGVIGLIIVSFTGFEKISTMSGEMKRPERNLPLSIGGSVIIATILYAADLVCINGHDPLLRNRAGEGPVGGSRHPSRRAGGYDCDDRRGHFSHFVVGQCGHHGLLAHQLWHGTGSSAARLV